MVTTIHLPYQHEDVFAEKEPEAVLDRMTVKKRGISVTKVPLKWKHHLPKDATWE